MRFRTSITQGNTTQHGKPGFYVWRAEVDAPGIADPDLADFIPYTQAAFAYWQAARERLSHSEMSADYRVSDAIVTRLWYDRQHGLHLAI